MTEHAGDLRIKVSSFRFVFDIIAFQISYKKKRLKNETNNVAYADDFISSSMSMSNRISKTISSNIEYKWNVFIANTNSRCSEIII